jgi:hypothetical protein
LRSEPGLVPVGTASGADGVVHKGVPALQLIDHTAPADSMEILGIEHRGLNRRIQRMLTALRPARSRPSLRLDA